MNASARVTMKDAANCDMQCELQNSVNHQISERTLRPWVSLRACLVSASIKPILPSGVQNDLLWSGDFVRQWDAFGATIGALSVYARFL